MQLTKIFLVGAALWQGVVAQQELLERLPSCAAQCFNGTLGTTSCRSDDMACLCLDQVFHGTLAGCYATNCTVIESLASVNETRAACGIPVRDKTDTLIGVVACFGGLALVMVAARIIDRAVSLQAQLGWDDLLIGLAGFWSIPMNAPTIGAAAIGFGRDIWGMTPYQITTSLKLLYSSYFCYQLAEFFCQLSILAFYLRIMTDKKARMVVHILMGIVTCFGLGNTFSMIFMCWPIPFFWDGWKGEMGLPSYIIDIRLFGFIRGGIEIALDLAILSLPLPVVAKLQMSRQKKWQVMSMFCVGFVITVVSCLRIWGLVQFAQTTNPTYDNVSGVYWCLTEANLFIIVACMPAMRAIAVKLLPAIFPLSSHPSSSSNPSSKYSWPKKSSKHSQSHHSSNGPYGFGSAHDNRQAKYWRHGSEDENENRSGTYVGIGRAVGGEGKRSDDSTLRLPEGVIQKKMDVSVYRTERSESDVELVDRSLNV